MAQIEKISSTFVTSPLQAYCLAFIGLTKTLKFLRRLFGIFLPKHSIPAAPEIPGFQIFYLRGTVEHIDQDQAEGHQQNYPGWNNILKKDPDQCKFFMNQVITSQIT